MYLAAFYVRNTRHGTENFSGCMNSQVVLAAYGTAISTKIKTVHGHVLQAATTMTKLYI